MNAYFYRIPLPGIATGYDTNNGGHPVFTGVDHIVRRHCVNLEGVFRVVIDMNFMGIGRDRQVTRGVMRSHHCGNFHIRQHMTAVIGECRRVYIDAVPQFSAAKINHLTAVLMAVYLQ